MSLIALLQQQFPEEQFDSADPHLAMGSFAAWDSMGHFNLMLLIEQHYGVRFEPEELSECRSLAQIRAALQAKGVTSV